MTATSLYDIGRFFTHGLNQTPEEFRAWLDGFRSSHDLERDREEWATLEADSLLDLLDIANRFLEMWEDDTHIAVVDAAWSTWSTWSIEHPLRCRATGNMAGCDFHEAMASNNADGNLPGSGRYKLRFILTDDGPLLIWDQV